jgi:hypothetical protein
MAHSSQPFREVWVIDFEFSAPSGERPQPVCLVAREIESDQLIRVSLNELVNLTQPPFPVDEDTLIVAYYASAEMGCFLVLGWTLPSNLLDLFAEFRNLTNGLKLPFGKGLIGALGWHGLSSIDVQAKESMRELAMRGAPYSDSEMDALLDYCQSDVDGLAALYQKMYPRLDFPRALLRGRYMAAAARIEHCGIPIDLQVLIYLRRYWGDIQDRLIVEIDKAYGVYEGRTFKQDRFADYLAKQGIPWNRTETGRLQLDDDTFKERSRAYPQLESLRELRASLSQMRLTDLAVGTDGRNRTLLSAFGARTGRNQPSTSRFAFGLSAWMRGLIKPPSGYGLAYVDYSQQEFGIAAALSADPLMMAAYRSGDPYLAFAKQAGAVPQNATKKTHKSERDQFKACVLAVQYGMGAESLAHRIGQPECRARELLALHYRTYRIFWEWSDASLDHAMLQGELNTVFGWTIHVDKNPNPRFLRNFLMQGNGAEMLRLACCLLTEAGISVCAPVHDAVLIEAPILELDRVVEHTKAIMASASEIVLDGFRLNSDVEIYRYPERYADERGEKMWCTAMRLLEEVTNA